MSSHESTVTALTTTGRWLVVGIARGAVLGASYPVLLAVVGAGTAVIGDGSFADGLAIFVIIGAPIGLVLGAIGGAGVALISAVIDLATRRQQPPRNVSLQAISSTAVVLIVVAASANGEQGIASVLWGYLVVVVGPAALGAASVAIAPLPTRRRLGPGPSAATPDAQVGRR